MTESRSTDRSTGGEKPGAPRLRERHASATRQAILAAARELFVSHGYSRTSVRMLAEHSGVAIQTLYSTFGSKRAILLGLLEVVLRDSSEPELVREIREAQDPRRSIDCVAQLQRRARETAGDIIRVLRYGAESDPDVADTFKMGWNRHRGGMEDLCKRFASEGWLRDGLDAEAATATALAITSLESWEEAIDNRDWSYDQYERWIRDSLQHALLG